MRASPVPANQYQRSDYFLSYLHPPQLDNFMLYMGSAWTC
jgi:hypothetical protein